MDLNLLSSTNDIEMAKILLEHPQVYINSPSVYCNSNNNEKCIKSYSESNFLINSIKSLNTEFVRFLMSNKDIDCNCKLINRERVNGKFVEDLYTPLYVAVEIGSADIVEILLSNPKTDIDAVNTVDHHELTALQKAMQNNNAEIIKLLKDHTHSFFGPSDFLQFYICYFINSNAHKISKSKKKKFYVK